MKLRKIFWVLGVLLAIAVAWIIYIVGTAPIKINDKQGYAIIMQLRSEFDAPVDVSGGKSIYNRGESHIKYGRWVIGSSIFIYGVTSISTQDKIIQRVRELANQEKCNFVKITFYDESRFVGGNRLPSKEMRTEMLNP